MLLEDPNCLLRRVGFLLFADGAELVQVLVDDVGEGFIILPDVLPDLVVGSVQGIVAHLRRYEVPQPSLHVGHVLAQCLVHAAVLNIANDYD